ncbi:MAG TPA: polysaccharide deacetylase family protein [Acidimicrobiia bacterium]
MAGATVAIVLTGSVTWRFVRPGALALVGAAMAATAVWLQPQRPDVGSLLVLSVFFGVGATLSAGSTDPFFPVDATACRAAATVLGLGIVVVVALRSAHDGTALLWLSGILVVAAGATTRGVHTERRDRSVTRVSRTRERIVGGVVMLAVASTTMYFGASTVGATWFGGGVTHGPRSSRMVALTFDDGPNAATTLPLLKLLDAHHIKATFFIVGKALDAYPNIVQALVADGQMVGNHSYHHDQWRWLDPEYPELERTQQAFARHGLPCPAWYRPPHGQRTPFTARVVHDHNMHMVLWDDAAGDWATNNAQLIAKRILAKVHGGSIILLHDGLDGNPHADRTVLLRAMPLILAGLRAKGLQPVRLDKLLGGPAYTRC